MCKNFVNADSCHSPVCSWLDGSLKRQRNSAGRFLSLARQAAIPSSADNSLDHESGLALFMRHINLSLIRFAETARPIEQLLS
jgi:hypothetical protein